MPSCWRAAIGLADDWLKVRRRRSLGLNKRAKFGLQVAVGVGFALGAHFWAHAATTLSFTRITSPGVQLGTIGWILWATFIIVAESNAVNLADGLDGLAAGSMTFCFICFALIGYWQYRHFQIYNVRDALDLALVGVAMAGACVGFLWWNAAPARIFMGDTGSLAIGTGLGCLALEMNLATAACRSSAGCSWSKSSRSSFRSSAFAAFARGSSEWRPCTTISSSSAGRRRR